MRDVKGKHIKHVFRSMKLGVAPYLDVQKPVQILDFRGWHCPQMAKRGKWAVTLVTEILVV